MARIVVTGANGFIGRYVVNELMRLNEDFVAVDLKCDLLPRNVNSLNCNIFQEDNLYIKFGKPEILLHLAWRDGFVHNSKNHMGDLSNHFRFLTSMVDSGVKQICVLGSMHEVGLYEGEVDENTPVNPLSQYGIAKNALRKSIEYYCNSKDVIYQWIRAYYIYSNDTTSNSIFSRLIQSAERGQEYFPFTSGKNKYDFIRIEDLANQICAVIRQDSINGVINCCSGIPVALGQIVEEFIKENNLNIKLNYGQYPDRPYDSSAIWGNNLKITKILEKEDKK